MAKLDFKGLDNYMAKIKALEATDKVVKPAVYDGASILHKAIMSELQALPVDEVWRYPTDKYPAPKGIKEKQKQGLIDGLGFSKMESKDGFVNVSIGFDGYNALSTERFRSGEPNALVARELVLGTSRIPRNDFVKRAVKKAKAEAMETMQKRAEKELNNIMKG